ncbi:MAG: hypothetical protein AAF478_05725 [Pseudomonadota bacterium]
MAKKKKKPVIKIFVSSPGDVAEERVLSNRVIGRLAERYLHIVELQPVFWEHEPLLATQSFQEQIISPSKTDIVACILWSRLGTRLPKNIKRSDGSRYDSGTEFEFEDAYQARKEKGRPDLLVYRKMVEPTVSLANADEVAQRLKQKKALDGFVQKWFHADDGSLVAAFHPFENSAEFETLFEKHLETLVQQRLEEMSLSVTPDEAIAQPQIQASWEGSPFCGLNAFEFEHAEIMFGRTNATSQVLSALRAQSARGQAFLLVLGRSGCGKSSVLRAGLLPLMAEPGVVEGVAFWRRAVFKPSDGETLFTGLANEILGENALPELARDGSTASDLAGVLYDSPVAAMTLINSGLAQASQQEVINDIESAQFESPKARKKARKKAQQNPPNCRLIILVDQFEELFNREDISTKERDAFIDLIGAMASSGKVWVVASLRSDFYHYCADYPLLAELKGKDGQYDILPPTAAELSQIIRQPSRIAGLTFEEDAETGEALDDMLRDFATSNSDSLPLLEFTLEELYKRRTPDNVLTLSSYKELGEASGAIGRRAEEIFNSLSADAKKAFARIFRSVVHLGVGFKERPTKKIVKLKSFEGDKPALEFIDAFAEGRLFVVSSMDDEPVVTLAHEALLRSWPRLLTWLEDDRELLIFRSRLKLAADRWLEAKEDPQFLLAAGRQLDEAQLVQSKFHQEIDDHEEKFVLKSNEKARRGARIKRGAIVALGVLTLVSGIAAIFALNQSERAKEALAVAEVNERKAQESQAEAQSNLVNLFVEQGRRELEVGNVDEAAELLGAAYIKDPAAQQSILLSQALQQIGVRGKTVNAHANPISVLEAHPNKNLLVSGDANGSVFLWDTNTTEKVREFSGHRGVITTVKFSESGEQFATASDNGEIRVWDISGTLVHALRGHRQTVRFIEFIDSDQKLTSASSDKTTRIWDLQTGSNLHVFEEPVGEVSYMLPQSASGSILTAATDKTVAYWDQVTGEQISRHPIPASETIYLSAVDGTDDLLIAARNGNLSLVRQNGDSQTILNGPMSDVTASPRGDVLAFLIEDRLVFYSKSNEEVVARSPLLPAKVVDIDFAPDGQSVVAVDQNGSVSMISAANGDLLISFSGNISAGSHVAYSSDGTRIVNSNADGQLRYWHPTELQPVTVLGDGGSVQRNAIFNHAGTLIATSDNAGKINIWDGLNGSLKHAFKHSAEDVYILDMKFSADDSMLITAGGNEIAVWDTASGKEKNRLIEDEGSIVTAFNLSGDEKKLYVGLRTGDIFKPKGAWSIWSLETGSRLEHPRENATPVRAIWPNNSGVDVLTLGSNIMRTRRISDRFRWFTLGGIGIRLVTVTKKGDRIVQGKTDGTIQVIRPTGSTLFESKTYAEPVTALGIDANNELVISGAKDGSIGVLELGQYRKVANLKGHAGAITSAGFVSGKRQVVSASNDGSVRIWNIDSQAMLVKFQVPENSNPQIEAAADGKRLLVSTDEHGVYLFSIPSIDITPAELSKKLDEKTPWGTADNKSLPENQLVTLAMQNRLTEVSGNSGIDLLRQSEALEAARQLALRGRSVGVLEQLESIEAVLPAAMQFVKAANQYALESLQLTRTEHTSRIESGDISKDGKSFVSVDWDGQLIVWNTSDWSPRYILKTEAESGVAMSPDSKLVAAHRTGDVTDIFDVQTGEQLLELKGGRWPVWSKDGKKIALFPRIGGPLVYDVEKGSVLAAFPEFDGLQRTFLFSSDFSRLAFGDRDSNEIVMMDVISRNETARVKILEAEDVDRPIELFSSDDDKLLFAFKNSTSGVLMDFGNLEVIKPFPGSISEAGMAPDGDRMVVVYESDKASLINGAGDLIKDIPMGTDISEVPFFGAGSQFYLAETSTNTALVFNSEDGELVGQLPNHGTEFFRAYGSDDNNHLVTISGDTLVRVWDPKSLKTNSEIFEADEQTTIVALQDLGLLVRSGETINLLGSNTDGNEPASVNSDELLKLADDGYQLLEFSAGGNWGVSRDAEQRYYLHQYSDPSVKTEIATVSELDDLAAVKMVSNSSDELLLIQKDGKSNLWSIADGKKTELPELNTSGRSVEIVADKDIRLMFGGFEAALFQKDGTKTKALTGHRDTIKAAAFSSDGKMSLTASNDGAILIWDTSTGASLGKLSTESPIAGVGFMYGDAVIAAVNVNGEISFWDANTLKKLQSITSELDGVRQVMFDENGKNIALRNGNRIKVWRIL